MIAIYLRVSSQNQTTDSQEPEVLAWAKRLGEENPTIYKDVISGKTRNRPALDQMLKDCRAGKITKIVCYKIDRLGRSIINLKELLNEFEVMNIPVYFTSNGMNTESSNPTSRMFLSVLGAFAEFERDLICERVRSGIAARRAKGLPVGSEGITKEQKDKIIALRSSEGLSMRGIAREMKLSVGVVHKTLKGTNK